MRCERTAATYDSAATVHRELNQRLIEHLAPIAIRPSRILDLGAGTGDSTRLLAKRFPQAEVLGVDWAITRLRAAGMASTGWRSRWASWWPAGSGSWHRYACADVHRLPFAAASVDLVVSSGMVHWSNDLPALLREMARVLRPGGLLAYAAFGPDTLTELALSWQEADAESGKAQRSLPVRVHRFQDMHEHGDALVNGGFAGVVMDAERLTVTYDGMDALIRDIRHLGESNAAAGRAAGLTHPTRLARARGAYDLQRRGDARVPATYELVYAHGWRTQGPVATRIPTMTLERTNGQQLAE